MTRPSPASLRKKGPKPPTRDESPSRTGRVRPVTAGQRADGHPPPGTIPATTRPSSEVVPRAGTPTRGAALVLAPTEGPGGEPGPTQETCEKRRDGLSEGTGEPVAARGGAARAGPLGRRQDVRRER